MSMHDSYPELYKKLWGKETDMSNILVDFAALPVPDPSNPTAAAALADKFFEKYAVGNTLDVVDRPYERMHAYEVLLDLLFEHNNAQFQAIHKGTPYYFLGWTALQIENFEKGIFYFDQAISEDIKKSPGQDVATLKANPGIGLLLLDPAHQPGLPVALDLLHAIEDEITNFSTISGSPLNKNNFIDKFITPHFFQNEFRTIATSIYSFILEYKSLEKQLKIRSASGGSLEPFFLHLFKGGLILESLLKLKNPGTSTTLGRVLGDYASAGNVLQIDNSNRVLKGGTLTDVVAHYNQLRTNSEPYQNVCFAAAYGIRNTTGHNLAWTDIFQNDQNIYGHLYRSILGSIFWTIHKLWVE